MAVEMRITRFFKPIVPKPVWDSGRLHYKHYNSRLRFALQWRKKRISTFSHKGQRFSFLIVDQEDVIQKVQAAGSFYEQEELEIIANFFPPNGMFVDIGSNTGQHSIYVAKILQARRVIMFEPVWETCRILRENIRLNSLEETADLSHLGVGLGDQETRVTYEIPAQNLGATKLISGSGRIPVRRGDALLINQPVDFIKIDTEGCEIEVLRGLSATIRTYKPNIFVEVDNNNIEEFRQILIEYDYSVELTYKRYDSNENYLIRPN
jgi:FkbM family methyltransferase